MTVGKERVDAIIESLLEGSFEFIPVRGKKPGFNVNLHESDINYLLAASREIFLSQPPLLELNAPLKICGKF